MSGEKSVKLASVFLVALWFSGFAIKAQSLPPLPPDPFVQLDTWGFNDTNWLSDLGYAPASFTNLNNPPSFDGDALQVDSTNAAWLQYHIVESTGATNLTFNQGAIEVWVLPDWNSGTGPGDWGRLIERGRLQHQHPVGLVVAVFLAGWQRPLLFQRNRWRIHKLFELSHFLGHEYLAFRRLDL